MLVVDTGVFVAAADLDDRHHEPCAALVETHPGPLITTPFVIAETGWLIRRQLDTTIEAAFYQTIAVAERLNQTIIATLDERGFRIVRPAHTDAFELLPGPT